MGTIYSFGIRIYGWLIYFASFFSEKAKLLYKGQRNTLWLTENSIEKNQPYIWVHAASLGEFEQGRPIIEAIKKDHPTYKIVLSFFSPSGYEVRKDYALADYVCYLPLDTKANATRFIELIQPQKAIFIKYEFWPNYLQVLRKKGIETYIISAIFRKEQIFFAWYGGWYKKLLHCFTHIFVQDSHSLQLLKKHRIQRVSIAGDTRFDRVAAIASAPIELPIINAFKQDKKILVLGSSWEPDEELLIQFCEKTDCKLIIAPHQIHTERIQALLTKINMPTALYTQTTTEDVKHAKCLVINTIGILSSVYRYADIGYIGGGFGVGIHNILEAAVFGIPVLFGPNYHKFKEAVDLVHKGGAYVVHTATDIDTIANKLLTDDVFYQHVCTLSAEFVQQSKGATQRIMNHLFV
jgi:3-deoxy-D-manno-octulosonic-acid transferase